MSPFRACHRILLVSCAALTAIAGCSADEKSAQSEEEVRTARCPARLALSLEQPKIASATPTHYFDGTPFSGREVAEIADAMTRARGLGALELDLDLESKGEGRCYYELAAASGAPHSPSQSAVLRTTGGKDLLDVSYDGFRTYLFPSSYSTEGLELDSSRSQAFFATISGDEVEGERRTFIVEIGTIKLADLDVALRADHAFIKELARDFGEYFDWESSQYKDHVRPAALASLPDAIRGKANELAANETTQVRASGESGDDAAFLTGDAFEIVRDGRVLGFVIEIAHDIDDPLWDGSGAYVYLDTRGNIVERVEWTG
jgi:hypothetical protein